MKTGTNVNKIFAASLVAGLLLVALARLRGDNSGHSSQLDQVAASPESQLMESLEHTRPENRREESREQAESKDGDEAAISEEGLKPAPESDEAAHQRVGDFLSEYYGASRAEIENLLFQQMGRVPSEFLDSASSGLPTLGSIRGSLIEGLKSKIELAQPRSVESITVELINAGGGDLESVIRRRLDADSSVPLIAENIELAVNHGMATLGGLEVSQLAVFEQLRSAALQKVELGQFDAFPLLNINALLPHKSMSGPRLFRSHYASKGWQIAVACRPGDHPSVDAAIQSRNAAFDDWWTGVVSIAGQH
ncbi:MAG: hypothetical protein ACYS26_08385 [Planctomycetota bacterium]|jgi:hypothetical protein